MYYKTHAWLVKAEILEAAEDTARNEYVGSDPRGQRRHVLSIAMTRCPCPLCSMPVNQVAAAAAYRELYNACDPTPKDFACPCCGTRLDENVPFMGPVYVWTAKLEDGQIDLLRETICDYVDVPASEE